MTDTFTELADGVFVRRHQWLDLNVGLVVGDDEALVIDTRAHVADGEDLRRAIAAVTDVPVRWVVNTHMHWDHTFGNAAFPGAVIVGHDRCRQALLDHGPMMRDHVAEADWVPDDERQDLRAVPILPPVVTTGSELTLHVGGRAVGLRYVGRGHTDNDVVVDVGDVTFAGDLLEESAPPAFGDDSFPTDWAATLDRLLPDLRPTVVPGHGAVVDRAFAEAQRDDIREGLFHATHDVSGPPPFPAAVIDQIRGRLDQLRSRPDTTATAPNGG